MQKTGQMARGNKGGREKPNAQEPRPKLDELLAHWCAHRAVERFCKWFRYWKLTHPVKRGRRIWRGKSGRPYELRRAVNQRALAWGRKLDHHSVALEGVVKAFGNYDPAKGNLATHLIRRGEYALRDAWRREIRRKVKAQKQHTAGKRLAPYDLASSDVSWLKENWQSAERDELLQALTPLTEMERLVLIAHRRLEEDLGFPEDGRYPPDRRGPWRWRRRLKHVAAMLQVSVATCSRCSRRAEQAVVENLSAQRLVPIPHKRRPTTPNG